MEEHIYHISILHTDKNYLSLLQIQFYKIPHIKTNRKKSKVGTTRSQSHTMLAQDSFLGSLLVLPVELWNGIAG